MKLNCVAFHNYELLDDHGRLLNLLTHEECVCIVDYFRHSEWRGNLEEAIDKDPDQYDFSNISRDEFLDLCIEEMQRQYENCSLGEPDYSDIVFSTAEDNGVWKE